MFKLAFFFQGKCILLVSNTVFMEIVTYRIISKTEQITHFIKTPFLKVRLSTHFDQTVSTNSLDSLQLALFSTVGQLSQFLMWPDVYKNVKNIRPK